MRHAHHIRPEGLMAEIVQIGCLLLMVVSLAFALWQALQAVR